MLETYAIVFALALIMEYLDDTLGMGFGTGMVPVLLVLGFHPLQVVPVVLISTLITGFLAAGAHWRVGNVDFSLGGKPLKIAALLAGAGLAGTAAAVMLAVSLPEEYLRIYIGLVTIAMGMLVMVRVKSAGFSWARLGAFGLFAAFNKGVTGGGYGPTVVGGQILSGVNEKKAVGITCLAEGIVALAAASLYFGLDPKISWELAPFIIGGAVLAVPFAAVTVERVKTKGLVLAMGAVMVLLGAAVALGVAA